MQCGPALDIVSYGVLSQIHEQNPERCHEDDLLQPTNGHIPEAGFGRNDQL